jgi:transposase InsO family protein
MTLVHNREEDLNDEYQQLLNGHGMQWYNRQRRHSALGQVSPKAFEKGHFGSNRESSKWE